MSWVNMGTANLVEGSTVRGYVNFEYDDTSGEPRSVRLRIVPKSGSTFTVNFNNITVDGINRGSKTGLNQNSGTFWSGTVSGNKNVTAKWTNPWYAGSKTPSITGWLPAGATAPSGGTGSLNSRTWNSINMTAKVTSWGTNYSSGPNLAQCVCTSSATNSNWLSSARQVKWTDTTATSVTGDVTTSNSTAYDGGLTIKGCLPFKIAGYGQTNVGTTWTLIDTVYYTPPAPLQTLSYTQTQQSTNVKINVSITGGNSTNNYGNTVTTYWRYSTNGGSSWSGWGNAGTGTPWTTKTASFTCAYGASVKIQAKQTYQSLDSDVKEVSFTATNGTAPSSYASSITASTWNSVTMSGSVNYGNPSSISGRSLTVGVNINGSSLANRREKNTQNVASVSGVVINNSSSNLGGDFTLKGMLPVYPYAWASNTIQSGAAIGSIYYLPPAPGTLTYTEPPVGVTTYPVRYTGVAADNVTNYDTSELRRTVRYKAPGASTWTVVVNDAIVALTSVTGFNIELQAQESAEVEAWMSYRGKDSVVSRMTITNGDDPVYIYGSVNGARKQIKHIYAPVNGARKKIVRVYASVDGVARKVFEDGTA